jgi:peptidoglycan hydrolase-like protein with peptidoglycan-binding domain
MVGRYLDEKPGGTLNKKIQPGELATIFANGLRVFPISQYYGGAVSYFTYSQGFQDAAGAQAAAIGYGFNTGTVIYFAVDYDATQAEIDSNIIPYFNGVVAGLADRGKKYIHGVYGSRNVCAEVTGRTYTRWSFVSGMSTGFSGNMGFALPENWAFNQIQTRTVGTGTGLVEIDKDVYKAGTDPASAKVNEPSAPADAFVAYVRQLYNLAVSYGGTRPPSQLVLEFLRSEIYNNLRWRTLIGGVDLDFVST